MHDFRHSQIRYARRRLRFLTKELFKSEKSIIVSKNRIRKTMHQIRCQINFLLQRLNKKLFIRIFTASLGTNVFFLNNPLYAQNFKPAQIIEFPTFESFIIPELFDYDEDGDLDIIGADTQEGLRFFENVGTAEEMSFASSKIDQLNFSDSDLFNKFLHAVDLDKDGKTDIVVSGPNIDILPTLYYYKNLGDGTFAEETEIEIPEANFFFPFNLDMKPVDFDLDGDMDILLFEAVGMLQSISLIYYENSSGNNNLSYSSPVVNPMGLEPFSFETNFINTNQIEVADFDNDGDMDIIFLPNFFYGYSSLMFFIRNDGASFATPRQISGISNISGLSFLTSGDLDDDGDTDLLFQNVEQVNGLSVSNIYWLENSSIDLTSTKVTENYHFQIYPNPVEEKLYLDLSFRSKERNIQLKIMDQTGNLISQKKISHNQYNERLEISAGHLGAGMYILHLVTDEFTIARKFVKP